MKKRECRGRLCMRWSWKRREVLGWMSVRDGNGRLSSLLKEAIPLCEWSPPQRPHITSSQFTDDNVNVGSSSSRSNISQSGLRHANPHDETLFSATSLRLYTPRVPRSDKARLINNITTPCYLHLALILQLISKHTWYLRLAKCFLHVRRNRTVKTTALLLSYFPH